MTATVHHLPAQPQDRRPPACPLPAITDADIEFVMIVSGDFPAAFATLMAAHAAAGVTAIDTASR